MTRLVRGMGCVGMKVSVLRSACIALEFSDSDMYALRKKKEEKKEKGKGKGMQ
jgi:hypothetical protein